MPWADERAVEMLSSYTFVSGELLLIPIHPLLLCFDFFKLEIQGAQKNKVVRFPNSTGLWLSGPSSSGCLTPKMRLERILKKSPFKFAYRLSLIYSSVNMKPWAKPPFIYFSGKKEMTLFNSITNFSILWKVSVCF